MEYRKLGPTDIDVSLICLGTMTWGQQNTELDGHQQIDYALSQGINFIDTAEMYAVPPSPDTCGKTEEIIGSYFATRKNRDKIILATKVAGPGLRWIRGGDYKIDRNNILEALQGSLRRMKTDYIDLYQLHWPNRPSYNFGRQWKYDPAKGPAKESEIENFHEVLQTLKECIEQGLIRHVGLSNETSWGTMQYLHLSEKFSLPRMVSIQNEYNLLYRIFEPDLAEIAVREQIGLLAWSPLAAGMLTGKYRNGKIPTGSRWKLLKKHNQRNTKQAHAAVDRYLNIARKHRLDPAQLALAFVNSRSFVTSNIIGATTLEQLKTDIASVDIKLGDEIFEEISEVRRDYPMPY